MSDKQKKDDMINKPAHYTYGKFETLDVIEDWGLGFHLGNVIKYVARADHKGKPVEDLKKAAFYLNRYIENLENETENETEKPGHILLEPGTALYDYYNGIVLKKEKGCK